jgi:calcineurin-like phosphoesterase family protein
MRRLFVLLAATSVAAFLWTANAAADPVIAAAGDIACDPADIGFNGGLGSATRCRMKYTSNLLLGSGLAQVLDLGDSQYNTGRAYQYEQSYDPTWGRVKSLIKPVPGNHEYGTSGAAGYFDYFGAAAGERGKGYYSYDIGTWHIVTLNSNCLKASFTYGCDAGSPQERWLRADLAAHPNTCTLAYWHHARFSSGHDGNNLFMAALFKDLYEARVDIVLAGHSHDYERFAPQDPNGNASPQRGVREFVVGTGGAFSTGITEIQANSEVLNKNTFGVLKLTLHPSSYDWQFVPEAGKTFTDAGSGSCVQTQTQIQTQTFAPQADARVQEANPATNYGTSFLRTEAGSDPDVETYLRFSVSGLSGPVTSARLRLYNYNGSVSGPAVYSTASSWTETGITWNTRPPPTSAATDDKGAVPIDSWVEFDVRPFVTGNGTYSFVLATISADAVDFHQREAASLRPVLVVVVG